MAKFRQKVQLTGHQALRSAKGFVKKSALGVIWRFQHMSQLVSGNVMTHELVVLLGGGGEVVAVVARGRV